MQTILTLMMPHLSKALGDPMIETKAYLIKLIRQLKRNYFRQLKMNFEIYEPKKQCSTCLLYNASCCQIQSAPVCKRTFLNFLQI